MGFLPFRFENLWLATSLSLRTLIDGGLKQSPVGRQGLFFIQELKMIKSILKQWNREVFGNIYAQVMYESSLK